MIKLFENIFGPGFWPNVIFAVSRSCKKERQIAEKILESHVIRQPPPPPPRWHFGEAHVNLRTQTEEEWIDDMNKEFSQLSHKV